MIKLKEQMVEEKTTYSAKGVYIEKGVLRPTKQFDTETEVELIKRINALKCECAVFNCATTTTLIIDGIPYENVQYGVYFVGDTTKFKRDELQNVLDNAFS